MTPDQLLELVLAKMRATGFDTMDSAHEVAAELFGRPANSPIGPLNWTPAEDALWIAMPWFVSGMLTGEGETVDAIREARAAWVGLAQEEIEEAREHLREMGMTD